MTIKEIVALLVGFAALDASSQDNACDKDIIELPLTYEEDVREHKGGLCFANRNEVDYNLGNSGSVVVNSDGSFVWRLELVSENALNMSVMLTNVDMSVGEVVNIYGTKSEDARSYTSDMVSSKRTITSNTVGGNTITVEYEGRMWGAGGLTVSRVNCGFRQLPEYAEDGFGHLKVNTGYSCSSSCEVNVTCYEGLSQVKQSVCRLIMNGEQLGTGTLVNNTSEDGSVYILTSAHLIPAGDYESCTARFNFESPMCQDIEPYNIYSELNDFELMVRDDKRDVALLKGVNMPDSFRAYWSGWNVTSSPEGKFHCVHHPMGDVRKVSVANEALAATYNADKTNYGSSFDADCHWRVPSWEVGVTEGGSSGSALMDKNNRVVGCLTGGYSSCRNIKNDYYWRLDKNWSLLSGFLDPESTGKKKVDGAGFNTTRYQNLYVCDNKQTVVSARLEGSGGYLAGHNNHQTTKISQAFGNDGDKTTIYGLFLSPYKVRSVNGHTFNIVLWKDQDGHPGEVVARKEYETMYLSVNKERYYAFGESLDIEGRYHVGVELEYGEKVDTLAFYYMPGDGAMFFADGEWRRGDYFGHPEDLTMFFGVRCKVENQSQNIERQATDGISLLKKDDGHYVACGSRLKSIYIYDINGRRVAHWDGIETNEREIEIDAPTGMYIVSIRDSVSLKTYKIIKLGY